MRYDCVSRLHCLLDLVIIIVFTMVQLIIPGKNRQNEKSGVMSRSLKMTSRRRLPVNTRGERLLSLRKTNPYTGSQSI
jgi:hypothetical protein